MNIINYLYRKNIFNYKTLAAFVILFVCMPAAYAAEFAQDASTAILSIIFGEVSEQFAGALEGGKGSLGGAFAVYNTYVSIVGVVIVTYITVVGVANSAQYGTPLGQKWSAIFMPIKTAIGASLLFTNSFGYSIAQVMVMWFILTGTNIANKVHTSLAGGGDSGFTTTMNVDHNGLSGGSGQKVLTGSNSTGLSQVFSLYSDALSAKTKESPSLTVNQLIPLVNHFTDLALCIKENTNSQPIDTRVQCSPSTTDCQAFKPSDSTLAQCSANNNFDGKVDPLMMEAFVNEIVREVVNIIDFTGGDASKIDEAAVSGLVNTYENYAQSLQESNDEIEQKKNQDREREKIELLKLSPGERVKFYGGVPVTDIGWLGAGALYYEGIQSGASAGLADSVSPSINYTPPNVNTPKSTGRFSPTSGNVWGESGVKGGDYNNYGSSINDAARNLAGGGGRISSGGGCLSEANFEPDVGDLGPISFLTLGLANLLVVVAEAILNTDDLFGYPSSVDLASYGSVKSALENEPLGQIAKAGSKLLRTVETVIGVIFLVLIITGAIAFPLGLMFVTYSANIGLVVPIIVAVLFALAAFFLVFYPTGIIFNIFVPVIPLMVWLFGIFGYLMICVEAMAAGPLVALALLNPGQDEVLGKAEQGLTLILNLMLRPVLMVIGLGAAIYLVRYALLLFSWGMNQVFCSGIPLNSVGAAIGIMFMYTGLIPVIIQQAFRVINHVPDKVIMYMGAGAGHAVGDATEMLGAAKGEAEKGGQKFGEIGKGTIQAGKSGWGVGKSLATSGETAKGGGGGVGGGGGGGPGGGGGGPGGGGVPPPA